MNFYTFDNKKLGEGSFGSVCLARETKSGARRAIKSLSRAHNDDPSIEREIDCMGAIRHPNSVSLFETFEDSVNVYLVMEVCDGGELFEKIIQLKHITEKHAARVMQQVLYAMNYMHKQQIAHRDMKPENLLLREKCTTLANADVKVADFGFAHRVDVKKALPLKSKCGSPIYVAPEVLSGKYDQRCDMWSCGVIAYIMLSGQPPFKGKTPKDILRQVCVGKYAFPEKFWREISKDCKDLIQNLIVKDVTTRFSAAQSLESQWVKLQAPESKEIHVSEHLIAEMESFQRENQMKKLARHVMAQQLDQSAIKELSDSFVALDADKDGHVTIEEFRRGVQQAGLKVPPDLKAIFESVNTDHHGYVDYTDFIAATLDKRLQVQEQVCWAAFRAFDANKDGRISRAEFEKVLRDENVHGVKENASKLKQTMTEMGFTEESIDFKKFMMLVRDTNSPTEK